MRIGLVLDRYDRRLGGVEQWTAQLADRLLARGHELHIVARSVAATELRPRLTPHLLPALGSRLALADAAAGLLRGLHLDVIHDMGFGWYCDVLQPHGGSRAAANGQNLLLAPAWTRLFKRAAAPLLPRYREFSRLCAKQYGPPPEDRPGRIVIAISKMVRRDLVRHHGVPLDDVRLVYNGVDALRFSPDLRQTHRSPVRRALGLAGGSTLFLTVAHNFRLKGVPTLLRAMTLLRATGRRHLALAVVGGKRIGPWQRAARRLGIADAVRFVGPVDDPTPYYAAADVYVQPTFYDPCSLVVLEALACGLPVVTSRFNGAGELMTPGVHGEVVNDPADPYTLAGVMARTADHGYRRTAAPAARALMLGHTLDRNVDGVLAVYQQVLARRGIETRRAA